MTRSARSRQTTAFLLACGTGVMLVLAMFAAPLRAEPWGSVFAAETDSAFFLLEDGALVRAPFHLNSGDTFWVCPRGQHVVRMLGSPPGRSARLAVPRNRSRYHPAVDLI